MLWYQLLTFDLLPALGEVPSQCHLIYTFQQAGTAQCSMDPDCGIHDNFADFVFNQFDCSFTPTNEFPNRFFS